MAVGGVVDELVSVVGLLLLDASFVTKSPRIFVTRNRGVPEGMARFPRALGNSRRHHSSSWQCQKGPMRPCRVAFLRRTQPASLNSARGVLSQLSCRFMR